mmetsp:Transcript_23585/g.50466  ORF Transcript_23585/g.50466 Transcript_23585/m.50466 type:complete len:223 (-) Transcript_23585:1802-2470(-)
MFYFLASIRMRLSSLIRAALCIFNVFFKAYFFASVRWTLLSCNITSWILLLSSSALSFPLLDVASLFALDDGSFAAEEDPASLASIARSSSPSILLRKYDRISVAFRSSTFVLMPRWGLPLRSALTRLRSMPKAGGMTESSLLARDRVRISGQHAARQRGRSARSDILLSERFKVSMALNPSRQPLSIPSFVPTASVVILLLANTRVERAGSFARSLGNHSK